MTTRNENPFSRFTTECDKARAALREHMSRHGLSEEGGWRIHEFTRENEGRTELVMRPVHSHLTAPPDLECKCAIDMSLKASHDCVDE
jgi:hypothetical protein